MIVFDDVSFRYKKSTLLAVEELREKLNKNTVITGPSGSGKSTILRFINGLIPHFYQGDFKGTVLVKGVNTRESNTCELFKIAGFVHQNPDAQIFNERTEKEIIFTLENAGLPHDDIRERLNWIKEKLNLEPILSKKSHELSGGEKHILTLASIIALGSPVILLDEPFATLDGLHRERLKEILQSLEDKLIIVAEHRIDEALSFSDEFIFIRDSKNRIKTNDLFTVNFNEFRVREPEIIRLAKIAGVKVLDKRAIIEGLKKKGYREEFHCEDIIGKPLLSLKHVSFSYNGQRAVEDINLTLHEGEVIVLLGPNGAGKTTLMKLMAGILKPDQGVVRKDVRVGYVPHNPQDIFFKTRVIDEIMVGAVSLLGKISNSSVFEEKFTPHLVPPPTHKVRGGRRGGGNFRTSSRAVSTDWVEKLIHLLSLEDLRERSPFLLSEGEKKRVAMAAVLSMKPQVLLLDEPTTGQDGETVKAIARIIRTLRDEGISIVVSTHDVEFAREISCKWVLMDKGKIRSIVNLPRITRNDINLMRELHIETGIYLSINGSES